MVMRKKRGKSARGASKGKRKGLFFPPKSKKLADIISIASPTAFRESIRILSKKGYLTLREYRALLLAQNRAKAMLKRKNLSARERKELKEIASIKIPKPKPRGVSTTSKSRR